MRWRDQEYIIRDGLYGENTIRKQEISGGVMIPNPPGWTTASKSIEKIENRLQWSTI